MLFGMLFQNFKRKKMVEKMTHHVEHVILEPQDLKCPGILQ